MSKKIFQLFCLFFSMLYLVYIIVDHFGYCRRYELYTKPTEHFLTKYKTKTRAKGPKTIACFTTDDPSTIRPFVNSLLDQSAKLYEIVAIIKYKNMGKIPEDLKKILSVHGYSKDYGDASSVICSVLREPEADTRIIITDPTVLYGKDFVQEMIDASEKNPNKIIYGGSDRSMKGGILIKPGFFNEKVTENNGEKCCPWIEKCSLVESVTL
jgi:hypothetical protein